MGNRTIALYEQMPTAVTLCMAMRDQLPCASVLSFLPTGSVQEGDIYTPGRGRVPWCYRCGSKEGGVRYRITEGAWRDAEP